MKRADKYPDTRYFKFYNANPKNRITGDCTFRAICTATNASWEDTVMDMARLSCETGYSINDSKGIERYLKTKGWLKNKQPRKINNAKYTGKEFCDLLTNKYPDGSVGNVIANIGGHHIVCIKHDGKRYKINDIWDSTEYCIGNYWIKE